MNIIPDDCNTVVGSILVTSGILNSSITSSKCYLDDNDNVNK